MDTTNDTKVEKKMGEYSYVIPENDAEKALEDAKPPKDRMLAVERVQKYEVTMQDMFVMRAHYKNEALAQLKSAVTALREYKTALTTVKTWEDQIGKSMQDIPELAVGNEIPEDELVTAEDVEEFAEMCALMETAYNAEAVQNMPKEVTGDDNLEDQK